MAYTKNKWKCGDSVTAEKLNNIEQGIANGSGSAIEPFYVDFDHYAEESPNPPVYNKTWQEAYDAFMSGRPVIAREKDRTDSGTSITYFIHGTDAFGSYFQASFLSASAADGYLVGQTLE